MSFRESLLSGNELERDITVSIHAKSGVRVTRNEYGTLLQLCRMTMIFHYFENNRDRHDIVSRKINSKIESRLFFFFIEALLE